LGLQVRATHKLKIRQMLAEVKIVLSRGDRQAALESYVDIMKDELNVRDLTFLERADAFVRYSVKPNFKVLGRRLGSQMKAVQAALAAGDAEAQVRVLETEGALTVHVEDQDIRLGPDDVQISVEAQPGFAAAGASVGVVVLDTTLDDELLEEGWFREVLARVQGRRKELDLDFTDRIHLALSGSERLVGVCRAREATLAAETLATDVRFDADIDEAVEVTIGDDVLRVHVAKA
jgi:isoleucyl-tRNA synthetase